MSRSRTNRRTGATAKAAVQRRQRNRLLFGIAGGLVIAALVVAVVLLVDLGGSDASTTLGSETAENSAPNFSFTLFQGQDELGGEKLEMAQLLGKPIVLNFWAGLCPPCRAEMPDIQRFYDASEDDIVLIGVDIGRFMGLGSRNDARNLLRELDITYPAGFTNDGSVVRKYEVLGMPTTVFINAEGEIFEKWTGALTQVILERITGAMVKESQLSES